MKIIEYMKTRLRPIFGTSINATLTIKRYEK